jgi:hypothetical protein
MKCLLPFCLQYSICQLALQNINITIEGNTVLLDGLHGCGTWTSVVRREARLRMLERRALRKIFVCKEKEVSEFC